MTRGIQACSQRSCVSSETSRTDTLQCSQKCQQQGSRIFFSPHRYNCISHTYNVMNSHLSPGYSLKTVTRWHHLHVMCMCMTVLLFHHIFPAPFLIPQITFILAEWASMVWHFPCKRAVNLLADLCSGSVQLNADLNCASSLWSDSCNSSRE